MNWVEKIRECIAQDAPKTMADLELELEALVCKFFRSNIIVSFQDDLTDEELLNRLKEIQYMTIKVNE